MALHAVLIPNKIMATNVDALNRTAVSGSDIDNGMVFNLMSLASGSGEGEVWATEMVLTGSLAGVWMAYAPEVVTIYSPDGLTAYRGINQDPRNFYTKSGEYIDAFKPVAGDIITLSADAFTGARSSNTFGNVTTGSLNLVWASGGPGVAGAAASFKYLATDYISIGSGSVIGSTQRQTAYRLVCINN
jgi:hypothetical protein